MMRGSRVIRNGKRLKDIVFGYFQIHAFPFEKYIQEIEKIFQAYTESAGQAFMGLLGKIMECDPDELSEVKYFNFH